MQSYDDSKQSPRIFTDSSPTCMDNRLNLGQIGEKDQKVVQTFVFYRIFLLMPNVYWPNEEPVFDNKKLDAIDSRCAVDTVVILFTPITIHFVVF